MASGGYTKTCIRFVRRRVRRGPGRGRLALRCALYRKGRRPTKKTPRGKR